MTIFKINKIRALGLCSGGLDSILSALVLRNQGIDVSWISFETPFFSADNARYVAKENNIELQVIDITDKYMTMITDPKCNFGKNMNPCMDCHALMFQIGGNFMSKNKFNFMFSGEVLGQRPMSQNKFSLRYVEKKSFYDGYILRPLSAKLLPKTIPEKKNLVNRSLLLDISGRSRKRQIKLAAKFGVVNYPTPGGGCLLTDKNYSKKLKDLLLYRANYSKNELELLRFGRHMRLDNQTKIIVGRNSIDNKNIEYYADTNNDILIKPANISGPVVVIPGGAKEDVIIVASSICIGYSKVKAYEIAKVCIEEKENQRQIEVVGLMPFKCKQFII